MPEKPKSKEDFLGEWIATSIRSCFISPNVCDSNLESANVVDALEIGGDYIREGLFAVAKSIDNLADAIRQHGGAPPDEP